MSLPKQITPKDIIEAIEKLKSKKEEVSYSSIARALPKSQRTGTWYSREYVRQILTSFPEGRLLVGEIRTKTVTKYKGTIGIPIIVNSKDNPFKDMEGEHVPLEDITKHKVAGRVVYGNIPLEIAAFAKYVILQDSDGRTAEYRIKRSSSF